jgi:ATP-dependent helicase/nuclease subunit B
MGVRPEIIHLPWDQPTVAAAVDWLVADAGDGRVDLSKDWVLLPTRQAGRRLREALAWACRERGGIFPPRTGTPFQLLNPQETQVTPEVACIGYWVQTLEGHIVETCPNLFPALPEQRDFGWRRKMAEALHAMRATLMEGGWDCAQLVDSEHCEEEAGRWRDLARLEAAYRERLTQAGLVDYHDSRRVAAEAPDLADVRRVVILGVTDISPVIEQALTRLMEQEVPVQLVCFGPGEGMDEWGRPIPAFWNTRSLPVTEGHLVPVLDERAQAEAAVARVKPYRKQVHDRVAVGVADPAVLPHLERTLADEGIPAFNPDGRPFSRSPLFVFLKTLHALILQPNFPQAAAFLRLPDAWAWAQGEDEQFTPTRLLAGLDEIHKDHLPASLEDAVRLHFEGERIQNRIVARGALKRLAEALRMLDRERLSRGLATFLNAVFAKREFRQGNPIDKVYLETAHSFIDRLREWESAMGESAVPAGEALALLLDAVGQEAVFPERSGAAVDIQGWLELAWEDAPHLIVAGCNEGHLPQSIVGDRFLPEQLRERLGLTTNAQRLARDVYLLELLLQSRSGYGRVELILGRQRANGDPLRPSRVLLRCPDEQLPERVASLFQELPTPAQTPAWTLPWTLAPRAVPPLERLSVTAFRSYLACPFRFYLKHALHMESIDTSKRELDALDFGSLVHQVVEDFGRDEAARELADPTAIHKYFSEHLRFVIATRYGSKPPLPVQVQTEIAERRLKAAALAQAVEYAAGWRIIDTESKFDGEINGLTVRGRIDRVERHEETGALRVLDYKTSGKAKSPLEVHTVRRTDDTPDYATVDVQMKGKERPSGWVDLQLPLYYWAMETEAENGLQLGYFNLPTVGADTGVQLLEGYSLDIHANAMACAEAIVDRVQAGEFWPAREKVRYDEFEPILFGQVEAAAQAPERGSHRE